jgi:hypothetical protein
MGSTFFKKMLSVNFKNKEKLALFYWRANLFHHCHITENFQICLTNFHFQCIDRLCKPPRKFACCTVHWLQILRNSAPYEMDAISLSSQSSKLRTDHSCTNEKSDLLPPLVRFYLNGDWHMRAHFLNCCVKKRN